MSRSRRNPSSAILPVTISTVAGLVVGGVAVYLYDRHRAAAATGPAPAGLLPFGLMAGQPTFAGMRKAPALASVNRTYMTTSRVSALPPGTRVKYLGPRFSGNPYYLTPGFAYRTCEGAAAGQTCVLAPVNIGTDTVGGRAIVPTSDLMPLIFRVGDRVVVPPAAFNTDANLREGSSVVPLAPHAQLTVGAPVLVTVVTGSGSNQLLTVRLANGTTLGPLGSENFDFAP